MNMKFCTIFTTLSLFLGTSASALPDLSKPEPVITIDNQTYIVHRGIEPVKRGCVYLSGTVNCFNRFTASACGTNTCPIAGHFPAFSIDQGTGGAQGYDGSNCGGHTDSVCGGACKDIMNAAKKKQYLDPSYKWTSTNKNYPDTVSQFRVDPDSFMSVLQGGHSFGCKPASGSWSNVDGKMVSCRYGYNVC